MWAHTKIIASNIVCIQQRKKVKHTSYFFHSSYLFRTHTLRAHSLSLTFTLLYIYIYFAFYRRNCYFYRDYCYDYEWFRRWFPIGAIVVSKGINRCNCRQYRFWKMPSVLHNLNSFLVNPFALHSFNCQNDGKSEAKYIAFISIGAAYIIKFHLIDAVQDVNRAMRHLLGRCRVLTVYSCHLPNSVCSAVTRT